MLNKKTLISVAAALFIFACSEKNENPVDNGIEVPFDTQKQLAESCIDQYKNNSITHSPQESREILVADLRASNWVAEAGTSEDSITVWWKLPNGVEYCFLTETRASLTDTTILDISPPSLITEIQTPLPITTGFPHNTKALILSPYQWDWKLLGLIPLEDETKFINDLLSSIGYSCTYKVNQYKNDQNISMSDYEHFNDYGVVAISSHGGVNSKGNVIIAMGVIASGVIVKCCGLKSDQAASFLFSST